MSSTYVFLQDSRKYVIAVLYAASVFEDLCASMSARYSSAASDTNRLVGSAFVTVAELNFPLWQWAT
jgi:hypothetical protein